MSEALQKIKGMNASDILQKYGNNSIPVDIKQIISDIGIDVFAADFSVLKEAGIENSDDILGAVFIDSDNQNLNIGYAYNSNPVLTREEQKKYTYRTRFTLAHELAHCCLHFNNDSDPHLEFRRSYPSTNDIPQLEYDANVFAGELLIPRAAIEEIYEKVSYPCLETMAELFQVSNSVMRARLDYLKKRYIINGEPC